MMTINQHYIVEHDKLCKIYEKYNESVTVEDEVFTYPENVICKNKRCMYYYLGNYAMESIEYPLPENMIFINSIYYRENCKITITEDMIKYENLIEMDLNDILEQ